MDDLSYQVIAKAIDIGDRIEKDFTTDKGGPIVYLFVAARAEAIEAMRALIDVDPTDTRAVMRLQNEVHRLQQLTTWINGALQRGQEAFDSLDQQQKIEVASYLQQENDA